MRAVRHRILGVDSAVKTDLFASHRTYLAFSECWKRRVEPGTPR